MMRLFRVLYSVGIVVGLGAAYLKSDLILVFAVAHVLALALMGVFAAGGDRARAGIRVQTAGYLHTLIGFAAALYRLDAGNPAMANVLTPLGSALSTSILGWWLGGELSGERNTDLRIGSEAERFASELEGFSKAVRRLQEEYVKTMTDAVKSFKEMKSQQVEALREATGGVGRLEKAIDEVQKRLSTLDRSLAAAARNAEGSLGEPFVRAMAEVLEHTRNLSTELKEVAGGARDSAEYLKESRILIEELEKLAEVIASGARGGR